MNDPEIETKTIHTALTPLLIIGSFCTIGLFEYPSGQLRPFFTCVYVLITWSLFAYFFYCLIYNSYSYFIYTSWPSIIIMITGIVSIFISLIRFQEMKMCLHKLFIVDNTLEILGTSKKYGQLRKYVIRMIFGWILSSLLMNILDSFCLNYGHTSIIRICVPFLGNHLLHITTLSALTWGIILRYTSSRFQQLNKHIYMQYTNFSKNNINYNEKQNIWIIMHVHLHLCLISRELNKVFSMQMTLQMTSYFTFIVAMCREIYIMYINNNAVSKFENVLDSIFSSIYGIVYSIIIFALNYICQTFYDETNKTVIILYNLCNENHNKYLREQVLQFILQIKQTKIKFGSGLSYFGYDFIRQFYKSVVAVLIIIIQMNKHNNSLFDK